MRHSRASGTLRIETVFRAFVGATSAASVTIRRLDETFSLSRKFMKTGTIETTNLKAHRRVRMPIDTPTTFTEARIVIRHLKK